MTGAILPPDTLVLWDVDLTLLDLRRMGRGWFHDALVEVTGREPVRPPAFGGRTDRWIAARLLAGVGIPPTDELIAALHDAVVRIAGEQRARIAEFGVVLPGVPEVLAALAARPDVAQSLVTGNLRPVAGFKVDAFDLTRYLDLEIGGYGDVSEVRANLVADAVAGATHRYGVLGSVVVVGDTPHDVHAALAHDFRAIGVATGRHRADELLAAGAHAVLPDLSDTDRVLTLLLG
ncbi:MAG TPA: haloacid dehalogenase-like hydrolase [Pseudonocardiaceae bacterium]|nr:haloacid dehalogenase-like hydrolase [Pseudonocardiaceae bacterium]